MSDRQYTTKQMGDAGEMLVAAELTLAGIPALMVPDNWPSYDVIAQPPPEWQGHNQGEFAAPQRISVKTRTWAQSGNFVGYREVDAFDWLAMVILPKNPEQHRRIFIVPRRVADCRSYAAEHRKGRGFFVNRLMQLPPPHMTKPPPTGGYGVADYEDNFSLSFMPVLQKP